MSWAKDQSAIDLLRRSLISVRAELRHEASLLDDQDSRDHFLVLLKADVSLSSALAYGLISSMGIKPFDYDALMSTALRVERCLVIRRK